MTAGGKTRKSSLVIVIEEIIWLTAYKDIYYRTKNNFNPFYFLCGSRNSGATAATDFWCNLTI